jgi:hypothetical protein
MPEKLRKLYNTLALIETKGDSTKLMAQCMLYTEQLIAEAAAEEAKRAEVQGDTEGDAE